jgi:hypothetical protein
MKGVEENRTTNTVERWGIFEIALTGPQDGNPFCDVELRAEFRFGHRVINVDGFYDGDGIYRVRFMPDTRANGATTSAAIALNWTAWPVRSFVSRLQRIITARCRCATGSFCLCRWHAALLVRHHMLCVDSPEPRTARANAGYPEPRAVQQDSHVRLPEILRLQSCGSATRPL